MLCGFGFFFLTAVNDILFANLVFTLFGYIISSGMVVFILFQFAAAIDPILAIA